MIIFVQTQEDLTLTAHEIVAHCGRHLADFKMPQEVVFRDDLPKTQRGKMDRNALTEEWKAANAAA